MMDLRSPGVRATVRMPTDLRGGLARLVDAVAAHGVGHQRAGRQRLPERAGAVGRRDQDRGRDEGRDDCGRSSGFEGEAIIDVREI